MKKTKKRFTVILIALGSTMILPIVYGYIELDTDIQLAVLAGIITIVSVYIGGQSLSDGAREWNSNNK